MCKPRIVRIVIGLLIVAMTCCAASCVIQDRGLILAAGRGHIEIVKLLLENGADVNSRTKDGDTALIVASKAGHTNVVKLLLERGADVNAKNRNGRMALMGATNQGHLNVVKLLLERGADVNAKDEQIGRAHV